jgi:hypothetical protein
MDGAGLAPTAGRRKLKSSCHLFSPYLLSRTDFRPILHRCPLFPLSLDFLTLTRDLGHYHTLSSLDIIFLTQYGVYGLDWKDCIRLGKPRTHCPIFFLFSFSFGFVLHIFPRPFGRTTTLMSSLSAAPTSFLYPRGSGRKEASIPQRQQRLGDGDGMYRRDGDRQHLGPPLANAQATQSRPDLMSARLGCHGKENWRAEGELPLLSSFGYEAMTDMIDDRKRGWLLKKEG